MNRRPRTKVVEYTEEETDLSFSQIGSSEEDEIEEWRPPEAKVKIPAKPKEPKVPKTPKEPKPRAPRKPAVPKEPKPRAPRKPAVPKEPKPRAPRKPAVPKEPKPRAPRKPPATKVPKEPGAATVTEVLKEPGAATVTGKKRKKTDEEVQGEEDDEGGRQTGAPPEGDRAGEEQHSNRMKEERVSFTLSEAPRQGVRAGESSSGLALKATKKEEPSEEEDFTFDMPSPKKQKCSGTPQGQSSALPSSTAAVLKNELNMNWDLIEVLSTLTCVQRWVCVNIVKLLREENTVPFMVRYRKEMINHMDADAVRDVQLVLDELCALAKKTQSVIQTLNKDGILTSELEHNLRSCRSADELDHVYSPYKKGSKLSKARRARELGLEDATLLLLDKPHTLDLRGWVKPGTEGLSSVEEVSTGVEQILADMIAKDPETLTYVRRLCENSYVTIQSSVSRSAVKEQSQKQAQGQAGPAGPYNKNTAAKDFDKFHLYHDFTCNVQRIQPHQTLAINRGESLKILTVKVNIPDRVRTDFISWCIRNRWRTKTFATVEQNKMIENAVEDSYKRLILPLLTRSYRSKLTAAAEKESIAMFVRNLRQRLLVCPVRGCVILGVDPGFRHGCKLAVLSPTSQILHTDVVYLDSMHRPGQQSVADKLRHLMIKFSCSKVVIGNGTACRETESLFADLISRHHFQPLDVSYCITSEAGASIYSVSAEAVKEMPDLDPNLRSAVSIGRRVQDPMAELVKIDPKSLGIGTYQHDVSSGALKAALDGVVQECVSFVGVDINICSEILMRHVSGLNAGRARSIAEWREQSGPFLNREQLKLVKGMGPKSYQQCAGFIRINPLTLHSLSGGTWPSGPAAAVVAEKPAAKKTKGKANANIPSCPNPLDQTCIHPESYHIAQSFLSLVGDSVDHIGSVELRRRVESQVKASGVDELARTLDTSPETLKLIIDGLTQPPGFDIRQGFEQADFKRGVVSMSDLRVGAVLTGRVDNATLFGAFVDIGVGRAGLIHKSNITANKLPADSRRRSLALGPGERVEVRVLNVDAQRGRIGLDLIRVLR